MAVFIEKEAHLLLNLTVSFFGLGAVFTYHFWHLITYSGTT